MTPDVIVVDHHDSYTWNLVHLVALVTGVLPRVVQHDEVSPDEVLRHSHVVLSPGPGHPASPADFAVGTAVLLAGTRDAAGLAGLAAHASASEDRVLRDVVTPLCHGLAQVVDERWDAAAATLTGVVRSMEPLGGSRAQREVVDDTLVHALAMAGRTAEAADLLDVRLSRRSSALDARRRAALAVAPVRR